ncbi:MAG TPA: hypothetical protein VKB60_09265 [Terriglobales bacterium]|nr:hypothetical protein [Terriglobales bacterium]
MPWFQPLVAQVRAPVLGANLGHPSGVFWQKRYCDRNVRDERELRERGIVEIESDWAPPIGRGKRQTAWKGHS